MSRAKIGVVVALVVTAVTAAAYVMTTRRLEARIRKDVEARVAKAQQLLVQNSTLEALDIIARTEAFARDERLARALDDPDPKSGVATANLAFRDFRGTIKDNAPKPDFIALVNKSGQLTIRDVPFLEPEDWRGRFKAVAGALDGRQVSKDIWEYEKGVMKVGVSPILGPAPGLEVKGALVVAYALN